MRRNSFLFIYFVLLSQNFKRGDFTFSLSGSKFAEWLSCESAGNSIATSFPSDCFNDMFLDFAFCVILDFEALAVVAALAPRRTLRLECEIDFRNNNGNKKAKSGTYIRSWDIQAHYESDHVFFWYDRAPSDFNDWLKQNCYHANKAWFNFKATATCWYTSKKVKVEVKRCGFQLLYAKDELNKCNPYICGATNPNFLGQLKEKNSNNKRSSKDYRSTMTSVIADGKSGYREVETHPKRLRQHCSVDNYSSNPQDEI